VTPQPGPGGGGRPRRRSQLRQRIAELEGELEAARRIRKSLTDWRDRDREEKAAMLAEITRLEVDLELARMVNRG
jgi:hypothetical protein